MRVLIAALADYASVSQPGDKLNVMGAFDTIGAPSFPVVHPTAVLALRLQLEYEDRASHHTLGILIVNQDGKEFAKIEGTVPTPEIPPGKRLVANHLVFFQQLHFEAPDRFSIVIRWDGEEKQRLPLDVVKITPPVPPPAAGG